MDILQSWFLHSNTKSTWIYTNQQQCIQSYLPALLHSQTALQSSKTVQPASRLFCRYCAPMSITRNWTIQLLDFWRLNHRVVLLGGDGLQEVGLVDGLGPFETCGTSVSSLLSSTLWSWSEQLCSLSPAHVIMWCLILGSKASWAEISKSVKWKNLSSPRSKYWPGPTLLSFLDQVSLGTFRVVQLKTTPFLFISELPWVFCYSDKYWIIENQYLVHLIAMGDEMNEDTRGSINCSCCNWHDHDGTTSRGCKKFYKSIVNFFYKLKGETFKTNGMTETVWMVKMYEIICHLI